MLGAYHDLQVRTHSNVDAIAAYVQHSDLAVIEPM
jgi:hypothetical protein